MPESERPRLAQLLHDREDISSLELERIKAELSKRHLTKMALKDAIARIEAEERELIQLLSHGNKAMYVVKPRMCGFKRRDGQRCNKWTQNKFAGTPMCPEHVAGGDAAVAAILESLFE